MSAEDVVLKILNLPRHGDNYVSISGTNINSSPLGEARKR